MTSGVCWPTRAALAPATRSNPLNSSWLPIVFSGSTTAPRRKNDPR
jgi:hypothetical protein